MNYDKNNAPPSYPANAYPPTAVAPSPYVVQMPIVTTSAAATVHDYLVWSIINFFIGWGGGLLPLIFFNFMSKF